MKKKAILMSALVIIACVAGIADAHALMFLDFEGLPLQYYFKHPGGRQNLGNYYPGVYFGSDVTILDRAIYGYNSGVYPPKSGNAVFFSYTGGANIIFDNPITYFEGWFSHMNGYGLTIRAFDALNNIVDSAWIGWKPGASQKMVLSAASIKRVRVYGHPNCWSGDSIKFDGYIPPPPVPEPATFSMLGLGILGFGLSRRRKRIRI